MDDDRIRVFLCNSLALWRVDGVIEAGDAPLVAVIRLACGTTAWIERSTGPDAPFRWAVRWQLAGDAAGRSRAVRPRACGSLVGVLSALRTAFELDRGSALRIAPAPDNTAASA